MIMDVEEASGEEAMSLTLFHGCVSEGSESI